MDKAVVHFQSMHESGNIYAVVGLARDALRKQRRITDYNEMWERVQDSWSYPDALAVIREYVNLIDDDGRH